MTDIFRLAIVGAGRMGRTHIRALSNSDRVRVVSVVEPSDESRAALDSDVAVYPDVASLVRADKVDGVLVAAPSTLHLQLVRQLATAGLHILCEKPCGLSASQAREAAALAGQHGVKL